MRTLAAIAVLLLVAACQTAPPDMTEAERAQVESEVLTVGDQWLAAVNGLNPDVFLDLFDPADTHATDGYIYANYEEWAARIRGFFPNLGDVNLAWASKGVEVFAPDAAMLVGQTEGTRTRADGTTSDFAPGVTLLVRRVGNGWKITYQGTAFRPPSAEG